MYRHYTPEEIQFVKKNIRGRSYIEMMRLFNKRFDLQITLKQMETLVYKHKFHNGLGTTNGYAPPNKGNKNFWKTIGKKTGRYGGNYRPLGSERITSYSHASKQYIEIKTGHSTWKRKHVLIWENANGKVPKGHVVIFGDGNSRNFDLDNLLLISRKELAVMNKCHLICNRKDLTAVGKTVADLSIAIIKRKKEMKWKKGKQRA
jgi:hypothetical protein